MTDPENQKPAKPQLSPEELATLASMITANQNNTEAPVTGRTASDAATEITKSFLDVLGKSSIYLIIVGLVAVAWYFVDQQQTQKDQFIAEQQAKKDAFADEQRKTLEQQRNDAFALVQKSYQDITVVAEKQITNLNNSLDLFLKISGEADEEQEAGYDNKLKNYKQQQALEKAKRNQMLAEASLNEKKIALEKEQKDLKASGEKLKIAEEKLKAETKKITQRGGTIGDLQDKLKKVSDSAIIDLKRITNQVEDFRYDLKDSIAELRIAITPDTPSDGNIPVDALEQLERLDTQLDAPLFFSNYRELETWKLANSVLTSLINTAEIISPFANLNDTLDSADIDQLIGVSVTQVKKLLEKEGSLGFDYWINVDGTESGRSIIVGFVQDDKGFNRWIMLETSSIPSESSPLAEPDSARVVDARAIFGLLPSSVPSISDWNTNGVLITDILSEGNVESFYVADIPYDNNTVSIADLFAEAVVVTSITGEIVPVQLLTRDQLNAAANDARLSSNVKRLLSDPLREPLANFDMLVRAKDPDKIIEALRLESVNDDKLRVTLNDLFHAVITKDESGVNAILGEFGLSPRQVIGELGAFVLSSKLRVSDVKIQKDKFTDNPVFESNSTAQSIAQSSVEEEVIPLSASVILSAAAVRDDSDDYGEALINTMELNFLLTDRDATWRLVEMRW